MKISVSDQLPHGVLKQFDGGQIKEIKTASLLDQGKIILFGVPGAFTPTCHAQHLPDYIKNSTSLKSHGIKAIYCITVNDPFVADAWARETGAQQAGISILADWDASYVKMLGLSMDGTGAGLGIRAQRFSLIADNGIVQELNVEEDPGMFERTGATSFASCPLG